MLTALFYLAIYLAGLFIASAIVGYLVVYEPYEHTVGGRNIYRKSGHSLSDGEHTLCVISITFWPFAIVALTCYALISLPILAGKWLADYLVNRQNGKKKKDTTKPS